MELGAKFWFGVIGGAIACAVAAILVLLLIGAAWARWGFFVMFLLLAVVLSRSAGSSTGGRRDGANRSPNDDRALPQDRERRIRHA